MHRSQNLSGDHGSLRRDLHGNRFMGFEYSDSRNTANAGVGAIRSLTCLSPLSGGLAAKTVDPGYWSAVEIRQSANGQDRGRNNYQDHWTGRTLAPSGGHVPGVRP